MAAEIRTKLDAESNALFSTARLWDDGIIDPLDTRRVLAMGISAAMNAPTPDPTVSATGSGRFGVFRM